MTENTSKYVCIVLIVGFAAHLPAQDVFPFFIKKKSDACWMALGVGLTGFGYYSTNQIEPYTALDITDLDKSAIRPRFDQSATKYWSESIRRSSDIGAGLIGLGASALVASQIKGKRNWWTLGVMGSEAFFLTYGLTKLSKGLRQRSRPFLYNPNAPQHEKRTKNGRQSFFSGHTALSAASCRFAVEVFTAMHPDSKWSPWLRGSSFVLPATVGFLRYRTGKHFPTDVFTGWAVGSLIGWLVPRLHRINKQKNTTRFELTPSSSGIRLVFH